MSQIHKTAIVSSKAEIDEGAVIGPYCIIGDDVKIGKGTRLMSHVQIEGITEIGENCTIFPFTTIGFPPQDLKYRGEKTGVKIGNNNIIREYVTIHRASVSGDGWTVIGDNNFIMAYVHIAHDCKIGNSVILANLATLAGHVEVEDFVFIGGLVAVHQFTRIGAHAMIGGFSGVGQDVPPFTMASGPRAKLYGLNTVGLKRRGFNDETINILKKAYKILFRDKLQLKEAIEKVKNELPQIAEIKHLIEFIEANKRGICR
ncbi:UDP-N-acetylglucosamine acyltransferase [Thermodesulfovibrio aggregans]|uniref:Acyl-[acyl-carrier-protein]--UDP-N-acetylglucosamine O-acyltransferase n=1 Tax=Thermodesulfovibrio aggregans TaxID=86166 RepID=A0A0U9HP55_9BACT|nr:acyl-ACP--UDP-N-acetylglucosamine O-acyltransferase [Thermodesulfovibrio aggregans]GAQ94779.1 UDP-N-acetylglucosamine acyltransferase [Thermodesulfovibrio aggregans]